MTARIGAYAVGVEATEFGWEGCELDGAGDCGQRSSICLST